MKSYERPIAEVVRFTASSSLEICVTSDLPVPGDQGMPVAAPRPKNSKGILG